MPRIFRTGSLEEQKEAVGPVLLGVLMPATGRAQVLADVAMVRRDLSLISTALAAYHAEHNSYPAQLEDLRPQYLQAIPQDYFSAGDFIYRRSSGGYLLYSVGENMKDDGGKSKDSGIDGADDLVVIHNN